MRRHWRSLLLGTLLAMVGVVGLSGCDDDDQDGGPVAPSTSEFHDKPGGAAGGAHGNSDN